MAIKGHRVKIPRNLAALAKAHRNKKARNLAAFLTGMSDGLMAAYTVFTPKQIKRHHNDPWSKVGQYIKEAINKEAINDELEIANIKEIYHINGGQIDVKEEKTNIRNTKEKDTSLPQW